MFVGRTFEKVWEPKIWVEKHCDIKGDQNNSWKNYLEIWVVVPTFDAIPELHDSIGVTQEVLHMGFSTTSSKIVVTTMIDDAMRGVRVN